MNLLGHKVYIQKPVYSRSYGIFVKFDKDGCARHNLAYDIGLEYDLLTYSAGCLHVKWEPLLKAYKFKTWSYSTSILSFPLFKSEKDAERFINLLNTHCLIQIR